jgi:hypothetical protein
MDFVGALSRPARFAADRRKRVKDWLEEHGVMTVRAAEN